MGRWSATVGAVARMTAIEMVAALVRLRKSDREIVVILGWPVSSVANMRRAAGIKRRPGRGHLDTQ